MRGRYRCVYLSSDVSLIEAFDADMRRWFRRNRIDQWKERIMERRPKLKKNPTDAQKVDAVVNMIIASGEIMAEEGGCFHRTAESVPGFIFVATCDGDHLEVEVFDASTVARWYDDIRDYLLQRKKDDVVNALYETQPSTWVAPE